jgi:hypothetical protein
VQDVKDAARVVVAVASAVVDVEKDAAEVDAVVVVVVATVDATRTCGHQSPSSDVL